MASARLSKGVRGWLVAVGICVWASGVGWLIAHYWLERPADLIVETHPSEPWWLRLHGAFAFLAIWTGGLLWGLHVMNAWGRHQRRWSGGTLLGGVLILILSGYLLYYVGSDRARSVLSTAHWVLGLALPVGYLVHRLAYRILGR